MVRAISVITMLLLAQPAWCDNLISDVSEEAGISLNVSDFKIENPEIKDVFTFAEKILEAARNQQWELFSGFLIMLLVWVFLLINRFFGVRIFETEFGKKLVPWFAVGVGFLISVSAGLIGKLSLLNLIVWVIKNGIIASGLWELIFKHVLKKAIKK